MQGEDALMAGFHLLLNVLLRSYEPRTSGCLLLLHTRLNVSTMHAKSALAPSSHDQGRQQAHVQPAQAANNNCDDQFAVRRINMSVASNMCKLTAGACTAPSGPQGGGQSRQFCARAPAQTWTDRYAWQRCPGAPRECSAPCSPPRSPP
jgi:hypothetical protein